MIEIGDIVIIDEPEEAIEFAGNQRHITTCKARKEVRAEFRFYGKDGSGTANFGLMMEYHPELEAHADAIRHYMKQQARMVLGQEGVQGG